MNDIQYYQNGAFFNLQNYTELRFETEDLEREKFNYLVNFVRNNKFKKINMKDVQVIVKNKKDEKEYGKQYYKISVSIIVEGKLIYSFESIQRGKKTQIKKEILNIINSYKNCYNKKFIIKKIKFELRHFKNFSKGMNMIYLFDNSFVEKNDFCIEDRTDSRTPEKFDLKSFKGLNKTEKTMLKLVISSRENKVHYLYKIEKYKNYNNMLRIYGSFYNYIQKL